LFGRRAAQALAVYTHHHDHAHAPSGDVAPLGRGKPFESTSDRSKQRNENAR
jgi:zinc transport system ATP-binding protein